ncbi:MAG: META domain-containing protein [Shimia sp.]
MIRLVLVLPLLAGCPQDETLTAYVDHSNWISSAPPGLTLNLSERGTITGTGPCNTFSAEITAPYPWLALGPIRTTRRACPNLDQERRALETLSRARFAEAAGPVLILTTDNGTELIFSAAPE